jgi:DNA (cytosine-5)-methyltransferase 1
MGNLTHFSLFTGIGGIDLAAEWAGFETVGQCEFADYPTKVLEKHWPGVPRWRDVRDVTAESIRQRGIKEITLLSGGFPCQPHSLAGKRKASADERDLWGEFARIICEVRPRWVLGENVPGLLSSEDGRFFGRILNDLARMGYDAGWCSYGIDTIGACHIRKRIFIVAHTNSIRNNTPEEHQGYKNGAKGLQERNIPQHRPSNNDLSLRNTNGKSELQTDTEIKPGRIERNTWQGITGQYWRESPGEYWETYQPPICGMDDGAADGLYKSRMMTLGNMVVPQQVYPILQGIADIEKGEETG